MVRVDSYISLRGTLASLMCCACGEKEGMGWRWAMEGPAGTATYSTSLHAGAAGHSPASPPYPAAAAMTMTLSPTCRASASPCRSRPSGKLLGQAEREEEGEAMHAGQAAWGFVLPWPGGRQPRHAGGRGVLQFSAPPAPLCRTACTPLSECILPLPCLCPSRCLGLACGAGITGSRLRHLTRRNSSPRYASASTLLRRRRHPPGAGGQRTQGRWRAWLAAPAAPAAVLVERRSCLHA